MPRRRQHRRQMHRHRLGQRPSRQLNHRLHISLTIGQTPRVRISQSTAIFAYDKGVGHPLHHLLQAAEHRHMHDHGHLGLLPQPPPTLDIRTDQRILDKAHDPRLIELLYDGQYRGQIAIRIEVPLHQKTLRSHFFHRPILLEHIIMLARMHLKNPISLRARPLNFPRQILRRCRSRPRRDWHPLPQLPTQKLVGRHL